MNGIIGVDSGTVWIGDPCYFMKGEEWNSFCDTIDHDAGIKNIKYDLGYNGKGVLLDNFGGDGTYGVTIKKNKRGLVTKAIIDFTNWIEDHDMEKDIKAAAKKNKLPRPVNNNSEAVLAKAAYDYDKHDISVDANSDSDENPKRKRIKRSNTLIAVENGYLSFL